MSEQEQNDSKSSTKASEDDEYFANLFCIIYVSFLILIFLWFIKLVYDGNILIDYETNLYIRHRIDLRKKK